MRSRVSTLLVVLVLATGVWQFGQGIWIHAKAQLAQFLISQAWQQTLIRHAPVKPWPWADTWPVARLRWQDDVDLFVLAGINGAALPFGPGMETHAANRSMLIAGHRDTHFAFLKRIHRGDRLTLTDMNGRLTIFQVHSREIINSSQSSLEHEGNKSVLLLVTCYPFDALQAGGALRYVVTAAPLVQGRQSSDSG